MKTVFIHTFQYSSFPVQCVFVNGLPWFKGEDVAAILGYTNAGQAIWVHVNARNQKTAEELLEGSGCRLERNPDFLSFPGIDSLIMGCSDTPEDLGVCVGREEAEAFVEWIWNRVVPVVRALPVHRPCDESCSDDDDEEGKVEEDEEEEVEEEENEETLNKTSAPVEDDEEEWCDFSTNRTPKYWLRKFNKTALMKECDKRGLIIDNPMTTLNIKIIEALITADTI